VVELREYRGFEIDDPKIEVNEPDIDAMVERLRDQASAYRPETERGLQDGDFAVIEITTSGEGIEPETRAGHFQMGEEMPIPELPQSLFGRKTGESASFDHAYGEDAQNEAFRGKTIHHDVVLKEIRVQEKPEVTDEFAKSTGNWESVQEMREAIGNDIRKHRESEVLRMKKSQVGEKLLAEHAKEERTVMRQLVNEFAERFLEAHELKIRFTEAAAARLVALALERAMPVRDLCADKFKDYQFGLKLIAQNTGRKEFTIDVDGVEAPDRVLSDWVVNSYRSRPED